MAYSITFGTPLTDKEAQVLSKISEGKQNKEIAHEMNLSNGTTRQYTYRAMQKMGFSTRTEVAIYFVRVLGCLLMAISLNAQTPTLVLAGPPAITAGNTITITPSLSGSGVSGIQSLGFSVPVTWPATATNGSAITGIGKDITCKTVGAMLNCVVVGLNGTPLADGQLASIQMTVPKNIPAGNMTLSVFSQVAAKTDATGKVSSNPLAAGTPFTFTITNGCDVNADGKVDVNDLLVVVLQAVGTSACTNDLDGSGKCDILDAQIVANAATGACTAK